MAELELADTGSCEPGQGETAFDPVMNAAFNPVMNEFCRNWKEACKRVDKFHENTDSDHAFLCFDKFSTWMDGFETSLFRTGDYENAKIIREAMSLWVYRFDIVRSHQIDELLKQAGL